MNRQRTKKSPILFDILFLFVIIGGLVSILFFTLWSENEGEVADEQIPTLSGSSASKQDNFLQIEIPDSEISESTSSYENIKIMTDISNDEYVPFAIQYPVTNYNHINEQIKQMVHAAKVDYIHQMKEKFKTSNEKVTGELNISFEIQEYPPSTLSFLMKTRLVIPDKPVITSYHTYVFNNQTGDELTLSNIMNTDGQSLVLLKTQLKDILVNNDSDVLFSADAFKQYIEKKNILDIAFTLNEEHLQFYFNELISPSNQTPLLLSVPLTSINSILKEAYQHEMVEEEKQIAPTSTSKKYVALTFDDGPHPEVTPLILNTLKKYNAKATFFMLGSRVQHYPDIANQVYEAGHEIGNHTWNHPKLTNMAESEVSKEYTMTEQAIIQAIGVPSTIFRPPYGATNAMVKAVIPSIQFNWTIDTEDWKHRDAKKLLPSVKSTIHPNAVILMHDIHLSTANGLEAVLQYLQVEGYEFVTVSDILNAK